MCLKIYTSRKLFYLWIKRNKYIRILFFPYAIHYKIELSLSNDNQSFGYNLVSTYDHFRVYAVQICSPVSIPQWYTLRIVPELESDGGPISILQQCYIFFGLLLRHYGVRNFSDRRIVSHIKFHYNVQLLLSIQRYFIHWIHYDL